MTRRRPASCSACALRTSSEPLVVQRQVEWPTVGCAQFGQHPDQRFEMPAQQGSPPVRRIFLHAVRDEHPGQARDLLEAQQRRLCGRKA